MKVRKVGACDPSAREKHLWSGPGARALGANSLFEPECVRPAAQHQRNGAIWTIE